MALYTFHHSQLCSCLQNQSCLRVLLHKFWSYQPSIREFQYVHAVHFASNETYGEIYFAHLLKMCTIILSFIFVRFITITAKCCLHSSVTDYCTVIRVTQRLIDMRSSVIAHFLISVFLISYFLFLHSWFYQYPNNITFVIVTK